MRKEVNFWDVHGCWFVFFLFFFPRLTLLFSNVEKGGVWWWLGWLFLPRVLVTVLATQRYSNTNPVMVALTWVWCLMGLGVETHVVHSHKHALLQEPPAAVQMIDAAADGESLR